MQTVVSWNSNTPDLFSGTANCAWGGRHHMVAEALPDGGWDWVAWANGGSRRCLSGRAPKREEAMHAAEQAALLLSRSPLNGRSPLPQLLLN